MSNSKGKLEQIYEIISNKSNESLEGLRKLHDLIKGGGPHLIKHIEPIVMGTLYRIMSKPNNFKNDVKEETVNILIEMFKTLRIDKVGVYFNISAFLLGEIFDLVHQKVKDVNEEYKLLIVNGFISLNNAVSIDIMLDIYKKDHVQKFSSIIYACISLAKTEKLRALRIAAMECIMAITKVTKKDDVSDVVLNNQIADTFMFLLPGLSGGLCKICMEDEKVGHKVIKTAICAWGRLINLFMKDYNPANKKINFDDITSLLGKAEMKLPMKHVKKQRSDAEIKNYIETSTRSPEWYKETDSRLYEAINVLEDLCNLSNWIVRSEFADISLLLLENCVQTIPKCISKIIIILITLSEDNDEKVSKKCKLGLENLSGKLSTNYFTQLLNYLEEDFYRLVKSIPRTFNGLDDQKQQASLNLLIGYIRLFGRYELLSVLHSTASKLIESLLYICELEQTNIQLLEEWTLQDFDQNPDLRTPWKRFQHFAGNDTISKLSELCQLLAQDVVIDIITDSLLDVYRNDMDRRKEATILLNEVISAKTNNNKDIIKTVINLYLESEYWNIPLATDTDEAAPVNLAQIQNNIVQICLQLEGIGKIALLLQDQFKDFLLKSLYPVLEKAGSGQPLLKAAGLTTITNISIACKYQSVTDLINNNSDYFSYHVTRKLKQLHKNEHVLNVLGVVMNHSSMDVLPSIADIVEDVLYQSRDYNSKNIAAFLKVFNVFIKCLLRWLNVQVIIPPIRSKADKEKEYQHFELSNLEDECNNFSDDIMKKTPEEMYQEDMEKKQQELEEDETLPDEEYKKPEPPQHIKLTSAILRRTLHFLPSKNKEVKILSLEILKNGLDVVREYEDELLPIVHQIWSPLVNRFNSDNDPLIFNLSFQLLMLLARLSKEFIRSRTVNDVLPSILDQLRKLSKESYLKDRGSAYRYTQTYKLQAMVLEHFARIIIDLELSDEQIQNCMKVVLVYLSNKQPLPLRTLSLEFFKTLAIYDVEVVKTTLENEEKSVENERNIQLLLDTFIK
ncbi:tel2 interacting protein 1 tti1 family member [Holotrichia oblita]|uniref:Tel2 interacting protein 1 tti1 family member n=1 Tax=Holotrichia oblita TaxID=644536 RepID=A0ACB9SUD3_HOLOL|nr:tel2 interacting protein 1 tti1 family member [Holotrichia oblita]